MRLWPQWRFFRSRIILNTNMLIIYTHSTVKPWRTNQLMPAIYAVSCANWKTAVWFFALCSKVKKIFRFAYCQADRRIAMTLTPDHNCAAVLVLDCLLNSRFCWLFLVLHWELVHIYFTKRNLLLSSKQRKNDDLPLLRGLAKKKKLPFFNADTLNHASNYRYAH